MREILRSPEFDCFYESVPTRAKEKIMFALNIIGEKKVISTKLVKKLVNTDFYEIRVSAGNEYRIIMFPVDRENFIEACSVLLLNGFVKKSTKDYVRELAKARRILNRYSNETAD